MVMQLVHLAYKQSLYFLLGLLNCRQEIAKTGAQKLGRGKREKKKFFFSIFSLHLLLFFLAPVSIFGLRDNYFAAQLTQEEKQGLVAV